VICTRCSKPTSATYGGLCDRCLEVVGNALAAGLDPGHDDSPDRGGVS
jgi:hypothetical protein